MFWLGLAVGIFLGAASMTILAWCLDQRWMERQWKANRTGEWE